MNRHSDVGGIERKPVLKQISPRTPAATAVISGIAEAKGVAPTELDPLSKSINLDALDDLFCGSTDPVETDLQLTFTVEGCKIILYGDGRVVVAPAIDERS